MDIKTIAVPKRLRRGPTNSSGVCYFWKEGRCNRNPCRFLHRDSRYPGVSNKTVKQSLPLFKDRPRKRPYNGPRNSLVSTASGGQSEKKTTKRSFDCISEDGARKNLSYVIKASLALTTKPAACEDKSSQKSSSPGTASEDKSTQRSSSNVTQDPKRKHPISKNLFFPTIGGSESKDKITQERSSSSTEEGPKMIRVRHKCPENSTENSCVSNAGGAVSKAARKCLKKDCECWMSGNCEEGVGCQFLHSWFQGDDFSMLANLSGHNLAVSGIALPSGSDKLYSGSDDGTVRVWDCHTGKSAGIMNLSDKIGSLVSEGPWLFVGIPNIVKAWNVETAAEFILNGPVGQVYAMAVALDMLLAGAQDGVISVWKGNTENWNPFQLATSLKGHTSAVMCLAVGAKELYSGSVDSTIRVWNLDTLQCIHTLNEHTGAVMSLICWNCYLLSCSLDRTIKVWFATEEGSMELTYTHDEEHGAITLCGVNDAEAKPILLCSCNDNSVHLYDLPSFNERGRIFSKAEVRTIQIGPGALFFTGDGTGMVTVWKMAEQRRVYSQEA